MGSLSTDQGTRVNLRKKFRQPLSVEMIGMTEGRCQNIRINGVCLNISSEGMGMITDCALKEGDVLKLCFPVAEMEVNLPVFTEVVWSRPAEGRFMAGLRFLA